MLRRRSPRPPSATALFVLSPLWLGFVLAVPGCERPVRATEADVLAILNQPRSDTELADLADLGRQVWIREKCSVCHVVEEPNTRGAPRLARLYDRPAVLIDRTEVQRDTAYLVRSIVKPQEQIVAGYPQRMSSFRHVPAADVAALVAYLEQFSPPAEPVSRSEPAPNNAANEPAMPTNPPESQKREP